MSFALIVLCLQNVRGQCPTTTCVPGSASAASQTFGMGIYRVQLAGLDTTTNGGVEGYRNYSCNTGTVLQRNSTYTLAVRTNPNADETVRAWVDFDGDGQFSSAEQVLVSNAARQHQAAFTVPLTALTGQPLRLRIAADYANSPIPTACSTPQFSQTEDYRVIVSATTPTRPVSRFAAVDSMTCGVPVVFRDQSRNTPTAWFWSFGDGTHSTQQHPQHTYSLAGSYAVRLRACNATGCDSLTKLNYITVHADAPRAPPCQPATLAHCCGFGLTRVRLGTIDHSSVDGRVGYEDFSCAQRAALTADRPALLQLTTGLNAHNVRVYLDLNDNGQFDLPGEMLYQGLAVHNPLVSLQVVTATSPVYDRPLRLRIWADAAGTTPFGPCVPPQQGQIEDYTVTVLPNAAAPAAQFAFNYQQWCGPVRIVLANATIGGATSYAWDFGDGTTSASAQPPVHTYSTPGVFEVTLVAHNAFGADTTRRTVVVAQNCPSYCTASGFGGNAGAPASLTRLQLAGLDNADPRALGVGYRDFTARYAELQQGQSYTLRAESLPFTFSGNGPWLRVSAWIDFNQDGNFADSERVGQVTTFSPHLVTFQVPLGAPPGATRLRVHIAGANQPYDPSINCTPAPQNVSTEDYTVFILPANRPPQAGFAVNLPSSCNATVQLQDTSRAAPAQWRWTFGDGATSTQQHPLHTYAQLGTYTVSLRAINRYGTSTVTKPAYITVTSLSQGPRPAACVPTPGPQLNLGGHWAISSVEVGPWAYTNPARLAPYVDETCSTPPVTLSVGSVVPVTLRKPNAAVLVVLQFIMWLDVNDDGVFDPVAERIFNYRAVGVGPAWTSNLNVPITALRNRPLRLRVWWSATGANAYTPEDRPCYRNETVGQVRDFTALVSGALSTSASVPQGARWHVYPNPSAGIARIHADVSLNTMAQVYDAKGRLVLSQPVRLTPSSDADINLKSLSSGIYAIRLLDDFGNRGVKKIIVLN